MMQNNILKYEHFWKIATDDQGHHLSVRMCTIYYGLHLNPIREGTSDPNIREGE